MAADNTTVGFKITTDAADATKDITKLDQSLTDTNTSVKSLRTQLKEAQADVGLMADKFGATSKEAVTAAKKAADLKDRIGDAKALTDAFNPDAKFKAVASSLAGVAGGFSALQGSMALFGGENKNVEAALLKVNAAMALSQGLQAVGESVDSFKQLGAVIKNTTAFQTANNAATKTAAALQRAFGIEVEVTSTGFKVLKGAIAATGIGLLVVALGEVIQNFDEIKKWIMNSPLGALAKGVGSLVEAFTDFLGVTSEAKRNLDAISTANARANEDITNRIKVLKAQGGSEKEIYDLKVQQTNNELATLRKALEVKGTLTDEEQKKYRELKNDQLVASAEYNKKVADDNAKAAEKSAAAQKKANDEYIAQKKKHDEQVAADTKTANELLLDLQNQKALAELESETDKALKKAEIDKDAKLKEVDALQIHEDAKVALRKAVQEKYDADVNEIDTKAKEERTKKDKKFEEELQGILSETRIAKLKEGKETELGKLQEDLDKATKAVIDNADYTEKQKGELITALKDKYSAEVADLDDKYTKIAEDKEIKRLEDITKNEDLSYAVRKDAVDKQIELNEKLHKDGKISDEEYTKNSKVYADARIEIGKKELAAREDTAGKISSTFKNVAKAIGETTVAGKAAAIAAATIDTYLSATAAFRSLAGIPIVGPVLGAIAAAAAIVAGIKNVKAILAVQTPEVPGGSASPGFVDIPSPGAPPSVGGAIPSTGGGGGAAPDLGNGGGGSTGGGGNGGGGSPSIRAYVVETDISGSQKRIGEIQDQARFE